jgi:hypothetical protein
MGASSCQAQKKIRGEWQGLFRFKAGGKPSSVGGADAIPTITAVKKGGPLSDLNDYGRVRHGHDALRACKLNPSEWVDFGYLKYVFMSERASSAIKAMHALREKEANELGTDLRAIAIAFFSNLVDEVIQAGERVEKVLLNITDTWHNSDVQELMRCFRESHPDIDFRGYNECDLCLIAHISKREEPTVVVDCGHSTMVRHETSTMLEGEPDFGQNVGMGKLEGCQPVLYTADTYGIEHGTGAQIINMETEKVLRSMNERHRVPPHQNLRDLSDFIDDFVKPEPEQTYEPQFGIAKEDWDQILKSAYLVIDKIINDSLDLVSPVLATANKTWNSGFQVIATGRWLRNPSFKKRLKDKTESEFPNARVIEDDRDGMCVCIMPELEHQ